MEIPPRIISFKLIVFDTSGLRVSVNQTMPVSIATMRVLDSQIQVLDKAVEALFQKHSGAGLGLVLPFFIACYCF